MKSVRIKNFKGELTLFLGFKPEHEKTYNIIRDYYVSTDKTQGIYFIAEDKESGEMREFFLPRENMNNAFLPTKVKNQDVKYKLAGIETGQNSIIIIETGVLEKNKKFGEGITTIPAKKYRYILKQN